MLVVKGPQNIIWPNPQLQQLIYDNLPFINVVAPCLAQGHTAGEKGVLI